MSTLKKLILTCPQEWREVVAQEALRYGATQAELLYKAVSVMVDEESFYRCHLYLSTPSHILLVIDEGSVPVSVGEDPVDVIYYRSKGLPWSSYFSPQKKFRIQTHTALDSSLLGHAPLQMAIRRGLVDHFRDKKMMAPMADLDHPQVEIVAHLWGKELTISLLTSGKALHKRGHRVAHHPAPLKETLAAQILEFLQYKGDVPLLDPMAGSGTIAIEGAYKALGKATHIHRSKDEFGFEHLLFFNRALWRSIQEKARAEKLPELSEGIYVSDIDPYFVEGAQKNALKARVEKYLSFSTEDFFERVPPAPKGLLVMNLPYGHRLETVDEFKKIGDHLKKHYVGWKVAILAAEDSPWKHIGLKTSRRVSFFNGPISTKLLVYELYEGSRRNTSPTKSYT